LRELEKLYINLVQVQRALETSVAIAGEKKSKGLAELNVSQMNDGIGGDGKSIRPIYTLPYAMGKGFETPNLKVKGTYHKSIDVEAAGKRMLFFSNDSDTDKVDFLEEHYDNDQYGIAPKNEQKAANIIESDLFKDIEQKLENGIL